jgi:VanZ family protein
LPSGGALNRRTRAVTRAIAPVAMMGAIFYLSSQPADPHHLWWEVVARKLGHVTGYAVLTALWAWALSGVVRRPALVAVCISLAYACTDEYHQTFVSGRTGTPIDVGVDAVGIALAAAIVSRRARTAKSEPETASAASLSRLPRQT